MNAPLHATKPRNLLPRCSKRYFWRSETVLFLRRSPSPPPPPPPPPFCEIVTEAPLDRPAASDTPHPFQSSGSSYPANDQNSRHRPLTPWAIFLKFPPAPGALLPSLRSNSTTESLDIRGTSSRPFWVVARSFPLFFEDFSYAAAITTEMAINLAS